MANIKSAKKRILVTETKAARNKAIKSGVKTAIKKVEAAVAANDKVAAEAALKDATSAIASAGSKGIFHKNNAASKVSHTDGFFICFFVYLRYIIYCLSHECRSYLQSTAL